MYELQLYCILEAHPNYTVVIIIIIITFFIFFIKSELTLLWYVALIFERCLRTNIDVTAAIVLHKTKQYIFLLQINYVSKK